MQGVETGAQSNFMNTAFLCMAWYASRGKGQALEALEWLYFSISWPRADNREELYVLG